MTDIKKTEMNLNNLNNLNIDEPPPSLFNNKKNRDKKPYNGKVRSVFLYILLIIIVAAGYTAYQDINKQLSKLQNSGDYKVKNLSSSFEDSVTRLSKDQREIKNSISQQIAPVVKTISYLNSKLDKIIKDSDNKLELLKVKNTQLQTTVNNIKKKLNKNSEIQAQLLTEIKLLQTKLNNTKIVQNYLKQQNIDLTKNKASKRNLNKQKKDFTQNIAALKQTIDKDIRSLKMAIDLLKKSNLYQNFNSDINRSDNINNIRELDILD